MLTLFRGLFGALMIVKGIDIVVRGNERMSTVPYLSISALWFAVALCVMLGYRTRLAAGMMILLAAALAFGSGGAMYNHHLSMVASICTILVLGTDASLLLRIQLSIVYGFATLAKINESFLSGSVLFEAASPGILGGVVPPRFELLVVVSVIAVVTEGFLAFGFWFRRTRRFALVVGVGLHLGMVVLMSDGMALLLQLVVYGGMMIALYIPFFAADDEGLSPERSGGRGSRREIGRQELGHGRPARRSAVPA